MKTKEQIGEARRLMLAALLEEADRDRRLILLVGSDFLRWAMGWPRFFDDEPPEGNVDCILDALRVMHPKQAEVR